MASTTLTYDALIVEQGFDPQSVTRPSRTDRKVAHEKWLHQAPARVAAGETSPKPPVKRARKRAS